LTKKDGTVYEGKFKNDLFDGVGKLLLPNGNRIESNFEKGMMHGKGIIYYSNNDIYYGEFKND